MMRLFFIGLSVFILQSVAAIEEKDSLLNILDKTIKEHQLYEESKVQRINEYKMLLHGDISANNQVHYNTLLIKEYESYSYDSAIHYINKNLQLISQDRIEEQNSLLLTFSTLLASTGRYHEAFDVLNEIKRADLTPKQLESFYSTEIKLNSELQFYNLNNEYARKYQIRKELYRVRLICHSTI